jgi:superfamily II DNA/RNA helicase
LPIITLLTADDDLEPEKEDEKAHSDDEARIGLLPRAVILAPTRELACQILFEAKKLFLNSSLKGVVVYGGTDYRDQYQNLSFGCDILVATPGRLIDIITRGIVSFSKVSFLVLGKHSQTSI